MGMAELIKIAAEGGLRSEVVAWASVCFFVVGGTVFVCLWVLNLWNAWKTRAR